MADIFDRLGSEKSGDVFDRLDTVKSKPKDIFDRVSQPQEVKEEPSLGTVGKGLLAEVALGEGLKYSLTTAGALVGGLPGAAIGYGIGALVGGITGSLAAQRIEGRDEYSWGRVAGDTLLNTLPPFGKAAKGAKLLPKLAIRGGAGAAVGATASATQQLIDEGEIDMDRLLVASATGGVLNIGLGAAGDALSSSYSKKLSGKTQDEVNANYKKGDVDTVNVVDGVTGGDPRTIGKRLIDTVNSYVLPTKLLGRGTSEAIREAQSKFEAAADSAMTAGKIVDNAYNKASRDGQDSIDKFIRGETDELVDEVSGLKQTLTDARALQEKAQRDLLDLDSAGDINLDPLLRKSIEDSIKSGGYKRTTYKFFEDADYKPSEKARNDLINSFKKDGKTLEEIEEFLVNLDGIKFGRSNKSIFQQLSADGFKFLSANKNFLKKKEELPKELQEYLGVYTRPGEKIEATLKGLGRYAAREIGDANVKNNLLRSNVATTQRLSDDYVPLRLGGKTDAQRNSQGQILYVTKNIQRALNVATSQDYGIKGANLIDNTFGKLLGTTTGLTKFSAVVLSPLNYPSQFISNTMDMLALGINPLKSFNKSRYEFALNDFNSTSNGNKFVSNMLGFTKSGKPNIARINRLKELQLMDKGVFAGDVAEAIKNGFDIKSVQKFQARFGKAYNVFDTTQRLIVFDHYKNFIRRQASKESVLRMGRDREALRFARSKLGKKASDEAIREEAAEYMVEKLAAEIANSQFSNYGRVSPLFKTLSRYGAVNEFGSYISEQLRTKYNQFAMAKNLMDGNFAKQIEDRYGLEFNQAALAREGAKKYGHLAMYLGALGTGFTTASNAINGMNNDEQDAYRRSISAEWNEFNPLLIRDLGDGKYSEINTSYQIPATDLMEVANAAMRGENAEEVVTNSMKAIFSKLQGEGLGQTINLRLITEAFTNRDLRTGDQISAADGFEHVQNMAKRYSYEAFTPSVGKQLIEGKFLQDKTPTTKAVETVLGLRRNITELEKGAFFKMKAIADDLDTISTDYVRETSRATKGERVDLLNQYNSANRLYKDKLNKALVHINDYRTLGASDDLIRSKIITRLGLSKPELDMLMMGQVPDLSISSGLSGRKRAEKIERYIDIGSEMPSSMVLEMLQQDFEKGKINRSGIRAVQNGINLKSLYE